MSKEATFVFISFLLFASFVAHAGGSRPVPVDPKETSLERRRSRVRFDIFFFLLLLVQGVEKEMAERVEECEGVREDECLMRRTLVAHTDYIYTQEHH
ncbi:hypothetical protein BHE74_00043649 [Ensete ventricosum]|nr:hypothetical protein GW17_00007053 [Ensete ventricosum]RWW50115.1 hypothetical protein BHE74_00043649 [Ensete ventricosum]RZR94746.1 hypothetical protein BHM03_00023502 [Ensete ventricosum]